mgnify:CR=1 FL=1
MPATKKVFKATVETVRNSKHGRRGRSWLRYWKSQAAMNKSLANYERQAKIFEAHQEVKQSLYEAMPEGYNFIKGPGGIDTKEGKAMISDFLKKKGLSGRDIKRVRTELRNYYRNNPKGELSEIERQVK